MGVRLGSTVLNVADLPRMAAFWSAALGLEVTGDDAFVVLRGGRTNLSLQRADTPVTARDQAHLDLYSDDVDAQVERLVSLGARREREVAEDGDRYVVLLDPEGNAFCVCDQDPG